MGVRVIGAGLGRTGTLSLKLALERLLDGPCYHMTEVFGNDGHVDTWSHAANGGVTDWSDLLAGYRAAVDWPVCSFWEELAVEYPDAVILLSTRSDAETWFASASRTIFDHHRFDTEPDSAFGHMLRALLARTFDGDFTDPRVAMAGYDAHNAHVRATAPPGRLVEYQPGDGWEPLCQALGVAVPDEPFPHTNTTAEFRAMAGLDD